MHGVVDSKFGEFFNGAHAVAIEDININCTKINNFACYIPIFSERIITVWNGLAFTDFKFLDRFKNSILATEFTDHLKCFSSFHFIVHILTFRGQLLVHLNALLSASSVFNHASYVK